jgi:DNA anti-recombination protein RmuC
MSDEFRNLKDEAERMSARIEKLKKQLATAEGKLESLLLQLDALRYEGDTADDSKSKT